MQNATNAINWFDLPVTDLDRAIQFYSTIFDIEMQKFDGSASAFFPMQPGGAGGAITKEEGLKPSADKGPLIYLNGGNDLGLVLKRVETAGGRIMQPKTSIGEHGYVAVIIDSEGNRVGLHSPG